MFCHVKQHPEGFRKRRVVGSSLNGYLWFPRFPRVDGVELLEHAFVSRLDGLLLVDVVHFRLPAAKHQDHGTRLHTCKRQSGTAFRKRGKWGCG